MFIAGLTGSIGCGKTTVAKLFVARGAVLVDADLLAREAVAPGTPGLRAVVEAFGEGVLQADGSLNRAGLAREIFANDEKRGKLEAIIHPRVVDLQRQSLQEIWQTRPQALVVLDIPLLFETNAQTRCDGTIVVACGASQAARLAERGMDPCVFEAIRARQMSEADKIRRADHVVDNGGDLAATREQVNRLADLLGREMGGVWPEGWRV